MNIQVTPFLHVQEDGSVLINSNNNYDLSCRLKKRIDQSPYRDAIEIVNCGKIYAVLKSNKTHTVKDLSQVIHFFLTQ